MVINHNSGADEEEVNELDGQKRWTKFEPKSGRFPRDWNCFHPSRYEQVMMEGENFAGFPTSAIATPLSTPPCSTTPACSSKNSASMASASTSSKAFGAWIIGIIAKYKYVKDGKEFTPYVVGEYWSGEQDIDEWLAKVNSYTDNQIAAFDFPLRYQLKKVCDEPNYDLRNLTYGATS